MKKIILTILLMPMIASASVGAGPINSPCIAWRQGMPIGAVNYNGQGICSGRDDTNQRLTELEQALDALKSQNSSATAIAPQPVYITTQEPSLVSRISRLEFRMDALEKKVADQAKAIEKLQNLKLATVQKKK